MPFWEHSRVLRLAETRAHPNTRAPQGDTSKKREPRGSPWHSLCNFPTLAKPPGASSSRVSSRRRAPKFLPVSDSTSDAGQPWAKRECQAVKTPASSSCVPGSDASLTPHPLQGCGARPAGHRPRCPRSPRGHGEGEKWPGAPWGTSAARHHHPWQGLVARLSQRPSDPNLWLEPGLGQPFRGGRPPPHTLQAAGGSGRSPYT